MLRTYSVAFLMLVAGANAEGRCGGEQVLLRPKWEVGRTFYIEWNVEVTFEYVDAGLASGSLRSTFRETHGFLCEVKEHVHDGGVRLRVTFDRLAMSEDAEDAQPACDSDTEDLATSANPICKAMRPALGKSYMVEFDASGQVQRLEGLSDILRAVEGASSDPAALMYARAVLEQGAQRRYWEKFSGVFAFTPVKPGDAWMRTIDTYRGPDVHNYTVESVDPDGPTVVGYTVEAAKSTATQPAESLMGVRFENRQTQARGTAVVDVKRGQVMRMRETGHEFAELRSVDSTDAASKTLKRRATWKLAIDVVTGEQRQQAKAHRSGRRADNP